MYSVDGEGAFSGTFTPTWTRCHKYFTVVHVKSGVHYSDLFSLQGFDMLSDHVVMIVSVGVSLHLLTGIK